MFYNTILLGLIATTVGATPLLDVEARDDCTACNPQGATSTTSPEFGSGLEDLYIDVLDSVKGIHFRKRSDSITPRADGFCCRQSLNCVNVQNLNIPMCYDKFTTNYQFPDGSYGSLTTGEYTSNGSKVNLLNGTYTKANGEIGNIYASDSSAKPNTATLSIPPQWTGTGVGSAIPASEIGSVVVVTTTIPAITITGATTIPAVTRDGTAVISAKTISGPTTIAPETTTLTYTAQASATSTSLKAGAAGQFDVDATRSLGFTFLSALMFALYGW